MRTYLKPIHSNQKSFYNKAEVENCKDVSVKLYSYGTLVTKIHEGIITLFAEDKHSLTTRRHIKEFLMQNGYEN